MLKNLLALFGLLVVAFAGAGYFLGWYDFNLSKDENGDHTINLKVKTTEIKEDLQKGKDKIIDSLQKSSGDEQDEKFVGPKLPTDK